MGFEEAFWGDELLRELRADCGGAKAVADVRPVCSGSDVIPQQGENLESRYSLKSAPWTTYEASGE